VGVLSTAEVLYNAGVDVQCASGCSKNSLCTVPWVWVGGVSSCVPKTVKHSTCMCITVATMGERVALNRATGEKVALLGVDQSHVSVRS
jgi:hypothetical protein